MRGSGLIAKIISLSVFIKAVLGSWQDTHMKEEHGIDSYDPISFFSIHDSDKSNSWTGQDVLSMYGLLHPEVEQDVYHQHHKVDKDVKDKVIKTVFNLIDYNNDGLISLQEWKEFTSKGGQLPDFGLGPGHHGDYELEYEVHHWKKYHSGSENAGKPLDHPEDIQHEEYHRKIEHQIEKDERNRIPEKYKNLM